MYLKKELYGLIKTDESIFDFIQESALDGLWYWDLENPENEWMNAKFWTVLGYNPDEMPHKSTAWQNIINQDDLKLASDNFTKHCENRNHPYDQVVRYKHKNGSTVWIRCRGMAIRDKDGKPIRMLGAHQDVSDIKNREQELIEANEKVRESQEKYRAFYNNAPLSYQSLDENGRFIDINPMWSKTLGYEKDEVIGKWYGDFLHPDYVEHFRKNFPAFKKRGYVSDVQFKLRRKDNTYIYVSFEGCIGYTPEGKFRQTYCVFKDITEQKALENALIKVKEKAEESQEKYRLLHENAGIGIGYYKVDGTIISYNNIAARNMNGVPEDFTGKSIYDFFPKSVAGFYHERIKKAVVSEIPVTYEDEVNLPTGNKYFISTYARIINTDGEIEGIQVLSHDITDRRQAEAALKESESQFRLLFECAADAIFIADAESGIIVNANNTAVNLLNMSIEGIIGKHQRELHPPEINNYSEATFQKHKVEITEEKFANPIENYVLRSDGTQIPVEVTGSKVLYKGRDCIMGIFRDITGRKQAEEKFKTLERQSHAWLENSPACTKIVDLDFNLQYMSSAGINGLKIDNITPYYGKPYPFHFYPESFKTQMTGSMLKAKETGEVITQEAPVVDINGNEVWFHSTIVPAKDENVRIEYLIIVSMDITERKKAEERLKENEVRFKAVIDSLPLAVHISTELKQHTEYINPSMVKMFGYTPEEILSVAEWWPLAYPDKDYQDRVSSEWNARVAKALETSSRIEPMEVICTCKDGTQKNIQWAYITAGGINYSLGLDITERKKAEEALLAKMDELERFHKLTVGREITMIELKKEVNNLLKKLGQDNKYKIVE